MAPPGQRRGQRRAERRRGHQPGRRGRWVAVLPRPPFPACASPWCVSDESQENKSLVVSRQYRPGFPEPAKSRYPRGPLPRFTADIRSALAIQSQADLTQRAYLMPLTFPSLRDSWRSFPPSPLFPNAGVRPYPRNARMQSCGVCKSVAASRPRSMPLFPSLSPTSNLPNINNEWLRACSHPHLIFPRTGAGDGSPTDLAAPAMLSRGEGGSMRG